MMSAASPGARLSRRKFSPAIAITIGTICSRRRTRKGRKGGIAVSRLAGAARLDAIAEPDRSILPDFFPAAIEGQAVRQEAVDPLAPDRHVWQLHQEDDGQLLVQDLL